MFMLTLMFTLMLTLIHTPFPPAALRNLCATFLACVALCAVFLGRLAAQAPPPPSTAATLPSADNNGKPGTAQDGTHDMAHMSMAGMSMASDGSLLPSPHASSGTGWQPADTPAHIWSTRRGGAGT